jgi:hypothetical protein
MPFEQVELHGASITTKADIGKGRSCVTVGLDAPLTSDAARALGCQEKLFTREGEVLPDLFFSTSVFHCPPKRQCAVGLPHFSQGDAKQFRREL